jgi:uncharacterized protein
MRMTTILLLSPLLCACASSPPVRFFVLDPAAPASGTGREPGAAVQIASVHIPATLDRRQMVREEAPNKLTVSGQNRWAAPLADMTQAILSQDLSLRLAPGRLVLPEQPPPPGTSALSVDIVQFGPDARGSVVLDGSWSLVPGGAELAVASFPFHLSQPSSSGDYAAQARAMSILLGRLADSMASALHTPRAPPRGTGHSPGFDGAWPALVAGL